MSLVSKQQLLEVFEMHFFIVHAQCGKCRGNSETR